MLQLQRAASLTFPVMWQWSFTFSSSMGFERAKFEYSPLGITLSKGLKKKKKNDKVNKVVKYDNDLMYNLVHNFNKYSVSNFNEILSLDSKFDTLEKFHNHFKKLKDVKKASVLYDELIKIYKKKIWSDF